MKVVGVVVPVHPGELGFLTKTLSREADHAFKIKTVSLSSVHGQTS